MNDTEMLFQLVRDLRSENQDCHAALDKKLTGMQSDIESLNRWKAKVIGAAFAVSVLVSFTAQAVTWL